MQLTSTEVSILHKHKSRSRTVLQITGFLGIKLSSISVVFVKFKKLT